jgi:hypothetical protein
MKRVNFIIWIHTNSRKTSHRFKIINVDVVEFLTFKTIGSEDFLLYRYENIKFDKIIEFNGFYVIKFKADVIINGKDILEKHMVEELEKKYKNKDKK